MEVSSLVEPGASLAWTIAIIALIVVGLAALSAVVWWVVSTSAKVRTLQADVAELRRLIEHPDHTRRPPR